MLFTRLNTGYFTCIARLIFTETAAAKSRQSCPTLCNPIDSSPPGSSIPGILQARTLERVAISFSNAWTVWGPEILLLMVELISPKKTFRWLTNTWKDAQHHSLSEKCKSKPLWGTTSHQSEWLQSKSLQVINAGEGVEKREPSYTVGGNAN